jgi:hypothetical protein
MSLFSTILAAAGLKNRRAVTRIRRNTAAAITRSKEPAVEYVRGASRVVSSGITDLQQIPKGSMSKTGFSRDFNIRGTTTGRISAKEFANSNTPKASEDPDVQRIQFARESAKLRHVASTRRRSEEEDQTARFGNFGVSIPPDTTPASEASTRLQATSGQICAAVTEFAGSYEDTSGGTDTSADCAGASD